MPEMSLLYEMREMSKRLSLSLLLPPIRLSPVSPSLSLSLLLLPLEDSQQQLGWVRGGGKSENDGEEREFNLSPLRDLEGNLPTYFTHSFFL